MGRIRGCNMAVVYAKIKAISGVLRESGGLDGHDGDASHPCAAIANTREVSQRFPMGQVGRGRFTVASGITTTHPKVWQLVTLRLLVGAFKLSDKGAPRSRVL